MTKASLSRATALLVGSLLALATPLTLPLLAACTCDPPAPPRTEGCDDPITDFSGVESVELVDAGAVFGAQGGSHFQFELRATGTGLDGCVAQRSTLTSMGSTLTSSNTAVRADLYDAETLLTRPVILFPTEMHGVARLRVEVLGRVIEQDVSVDPSVRLDAATGLDAGP